MNDRQLLELAAEAAGIEYCGPQSGTNVSLRDTPYWNPLENDGDALRLAVRLRFCVTPGSVRVWVDPPGEHHYAATTERYDHDEMAATRRAIVRAAAELARIARAPRPE